MATDPNAGASAGLIGPCERAAAVTPNDGADVTFTTRALYVGVGGDVSVVTSGGDTVTLVGVPGGAVLPIRANRVRATGTTATSIVALW